MSFKKHIPNSLTCCNLISGAIATCFAMFGEFKLALIWMIVGAIFDFFDGMVARLLHVSSPIGKELDSLADDITFGLAPATILFTEFQVINLPEVLEPLRNYLPFVAFLLAAFSALRLAKFNLDERQSMGFIGLPTPANALFWGSILISKASWIENLNNGFVLLIILLLVSCWLLVSEIPMFALKFKTWGWKDNQVRYLFIIYALALLIIFGILSAWWLIISSYVVLSVVLSYVKKPSNVVQ